MLRSFAALVVAVLAAPAAAQLADLAVKFGAREAFYGVALSPDGSKITYLNPIVGKGTVVMAVDIATSQMKPILNSGDATTRISYCDWIKRDRLACQIIAERDSIGENFRVSRIVAVNGDGSNIKEIGANQTDRAIGVNAYGGTVIDNLPDDPDNVLMEIYRLDEDTAGSLIAKARGGLAVALVNVRTGQQKIVEKPESNGWSFFSDRNGKVRLKVLADLKEVADYSIQLDRKLSYFYRTRTSNAWLPLARSDLFANNRFEVAAFDDTGDNIYVFNPKDGRQAMYKIAADGTGTGVLVYAHPRVDVYGLRIAGPRSRPVAVTYSDEFNHVHYLDKNFEKLATALSRVLPGSPEVKIIDESWDGMKLLAFAGSDRDPGAYYLYDKGTRQLGKLSDLRPQLQGMTLGEMKPVTYPARDGTLIPAYLSLPPGREPKNLPVIVMPHGGPSSRDTWGFDWLSQFYAQLGYAVIQPNFRGSAGYGDNWFKKNGYQSWRTAMGDINDAARWLVAQGIGDAKRLAIVGWSYGGYAALQANVTEPDLYKAIIAIAPVTDLQKMKLDARDTGNGILMRNFVGTGPEVDAGSPAKNAAAIKAPVLMFHGTRDLNVDIEQSRVMLGALKGAGKTVDLVEYKDLEHSLIDSGIRADMLLKTAKFLQTNLQ